MIFKKYKMMEEYLSRNIYGMRLRGFSLGAQPIRGLIGVLSAENKEKLDSENNYHDLIEYERELTDEELERYELDKIDEVV